MFTVMYGTKKMLTIIEVQAQLQNLTNRRISFTEIGIALGTGRANISKRVNSGSILKEDEIKKIENHFNLTLGKQTVNNQNDIIKTNQMPVIDRVEITYWSELPEELKNPNIVSCWFDREVIENSWGMSAEHLSIITMVGDKMTRYWYPMRSGDILIIDTSQNQIMGNGVYFATSENNTRFWIREMQVLINNDIQFKGFAPSGETVKSYTMQQLEAVGFKLIGKVIKNVSFRL